MKLLISLFIASIFLSGCSIPNIQDLRSTPPNERFVVKAPFECLYNMGVEHVSSYIGMTEPRFTWYLDQKQNYAWFRQPLTLVELYKKEANTTEIHRKQTPSASSFGQGNELLRYLKSNPCDIKE